MNADIEVEAARLLDGAVTQMIETAERLGATKDQVAEAMGVSVARVDQITSGEANIRLVTLARFLGALGCRARIVVEPITAPKGAFFMPENEQEDT